MVNQGSTPARVCPTCGTRLAQSATRCVVCGRELKADEFETGLPGLVPAHAVSTCRHRTACGLCVGDGGCHLHRLASGGWSRRAHTDPHALADTYADTHPGPDVHRDAGADTHPPAADRIHGGCERHMRRPGVSISSFCAVHHRREQAGAGVPALCRTDDPDPATHAYAAATTNLHLAPRGGYACRLRDADLHRPGERHPGGNRPELQRRHAGDYGLQRHGERDRVRRPGSHHPALRAGPHSRTLPHRHTTATLPCSQSAPADGWRTLHVGQ